MTTLLSSKHHSSEVYHDIYDFSIFPISLGDIITWGVKSALRASLAGRKKVHVHLICDTQKAGFNPLQPGTYLVDLLVVEALPAFYSHPLFSGLSLYRSREDFQGTFSKIALEDDLAQEAYRENEVKFKDRKDLERTCEYFGSRCTFHDDVNEHYKKTGTFPKVGYLEPSLVDWHALQSQFPKETFWVTVQFRLRKLDGGMPILSEEGLRRDAPFLTWYNFISEANKEHPSVRFVLLGRLQEKPLELLRLPNVVVLRPLGMNLSHEITALLHSDLYMGSASGFAQAAHFSEVPYDIFNCTPAGCKNYGIPYGTDRIPIATPRQRLHYEVEDPTILMECLKRALEESPKKISQPGTLETNRAVSTNRFFLDDAQSEAELSGILSVQLIAIAYAIERGKYQVAQDELAKLRSLPRFVPQWPDFHYLSNLLDTLLAEVSEADRTEAWQNHRNELLVQVSSYCHPTRLILRSGRYFDNNHCSEGFRRDGWCEERAKLVFAASKKGDFLIIQIGRLALDEPTALTVRINEQKAVPFVLLNEHTVLEIPVLELNIPTEVFLESDRSFKLSTRDEKKYSYQIDGAGLVSKQSPMPTSFRGNKSDPREKIASGIYANGSASNLARIRIDNPLPESEEIMVRVTGTLPLRLQRGQNFRIQINDDEALETFISGKHFQACLPCPGRPRHLSILLQFWDKNGSEMEPKENRAVIKQIDILPRTSKNTSVRSGHLASVNYALSTLKAKIVKSSAS